MDAVENLAEGLSEIYGSISEITFALGQGRKALSSVAARHSTATSKIFMGKGNPNDEGATFQHQSSVNDVLSRLAKDEVHERWLQRSGIVLAFELWEHEARPAIASETKRLKKEIVSDTWGDMRHFRNACAHFNTKLEEQPLKLAYGTKGFPFSLTRDQFHDLFDQLFVECGRLSTSYYGVERDFNFSRPAPK